MVFERSRHFARAQRILRDPRTAFVGPAAACAVAFCVWLPLLGGWASLWLVPAAVLLTEAYRREQDRRDHLRAFDLERALERARLAHEVNNPLSVLTDQLEQASRALDTLRDRGNARRHVVAALGAADRVAEVVRELDPSLVVGHTRTTLESGPVPRPLRAQILVIDDEPQVAASLKRMLHRHDVTIATSGDQARALLDQCRFDVVLSDVMMPEPAGIDVFASVRQRDPEQARRFVFVTGGVFTARARDLLAGVHNLRLNKPVDSLELEHAIATVMHGTEEVVVRGAG